MAKEHIVPVRFKPELHARISLLAKKLHTGASDIVRRSVEVALTTFDETGDYRFLMEHTRLPRQEKPFTLTQIIGNEKYPSKVADDPSSVRDDPPPAGKSKKRRA